MSRKCSSFASCPKAHHPLQKLQAPLTREEEIDFTHLVRIKLNNQRRNTTDSQLQGGSQLPPPKKGHPNREQVTFCTFFEKETGKPCEQKADRIPQPLTPWSSRAQNLNWGKQERTEILKAAGCGEVHVSSTLQWPQNSQHGCHWAEQNRQPERFRKQLGSKLTVNRKINFQKDLMCAKPVGVE